MGKIVIKNADGTLNATGCTATVDNTGVGIISNTIDGVSALINGDPVSTTEFRYATLAIGIGNTIATSMFTRSRVEDGLAPVLKVLF